MEMALGWGLDSLLPEVESIISERLDTSHDLIMSDTEYGSYPVRSPRYLNVMHSPLNTFPA